jgi:hypothetical protein
MSVIPAVQKAEIGRIGVWDLPREKARETPSQSIS